MDHAIMRHVSESQLNAYLDDLLEEPDRRQVKNHLVECPECRLRYQELEVVFSNLSALPETKLTHDLTPVILSRLSQVRSLSVLSRTLAVQWGMVLGVSLWGAMQVVSSIKFPSLEVWMKLAFIELPAFSASLFQVPSLSVPELEIPQISLPRFDLQFSFHQIALVLACSSVLWLAGNYTLLRRIKRMPS
jgi:hypothetical protein